MEKKKRKRPGISKQAAQAQVDSIEKRSEGALHLLDGNKWIWFFIMPPYNDKGKAWHEVERHGWLVCPARHSAGKSCRMCAEIRKRLRKGDTEFADKFKIQPRGLANAVRKEDIKKFNTDPSVNKVLSMSPKMFSDFMEHIMDELNGGVDVTDPATAQLFGIKPNGKSGRAKRYTVKWGDTYDISQYVSDKALDENLYNLEVIRQSLPATDKVLRDAIQEYDAEHGTSDFSDDSDDFTDTFQEEDDLFSDDFGDTTSELDSSSDDFGDLDDLDDLAPAEEEAPAPKRRRKKKA